MADGETPVNRIRDMVLFALLAAAVALAAWRALMPISSGTELFFSMDQDLGAGVRIAGVSVLPEGDSAYRIGLRYEAVGDPPYGHSYTIVFHLVPQDLAWLDATEQEQGFRRLDFVPDPPIGSWRGRYRHGTSLVLPHTGNRGVAFVFSVWDVGEQTAVSDAKTLTIDFDEVDRGAGGRYADDLAGMEKGRATALVVFAVVWFALLGVVWGMDRLREKRRRWHLVVEG